MNSRVSVIIFAVAVALAFSGCGKKEASTAPSRPLYFTCSDFVPAMPLESGDATSKEGKAFFRTSTEDAPVSYSFETLPDDAQAKTVVANTPPAFSNVLRRNDLKDANGNRVGEKIAYIKLNGEYNLIWNRGPMVFRVVSDSVIAVREFESACGLLQ